MRIYKVKGANESRKSPKIEDKHSVKWILKKKSPRIPQLEKMKFKSQTVFNRVLNTAQAVNKSWNKFSTNSQTGFTIILNTVQTINNLRRGEGYRAFTLPLKSKMSHTNHEHVEGSIGNSLSPYLFKFVIFPMLY